MSSGKQPKKVSGVNLYWWLLEGDNVANITKLISINLLENYMLIFPLTNWKDVLFQQLILRLIQMNNRHSKYCHSTIQKIK